MRARSDGCLLLVVSVGRVVGGGALLHFLGAPAWAVAAWLMLNVRIRIGQARLNTPPVPTSSGRR